MKLHDNQTFFTLYYEPNAAEVATGEADWFASAEWQCETKRLCIATAVLGKIDVRRNPNTITT